MYAYIYIYILCGWVSLGLNLRCKASGSTWVLSCCWLCAEATMPMRPFLHTGPSHIEIKKNRHHKRQNHAGPTWHVEEDNSPQGNCYVRFRQTCDPSVFGCFTVCIGGLWYSRKKPRVMKRMAITDLNSIVWIVQDSRWQWTSAKFWHMTQIKMSYDLQAKNENNRITLHHLLLSEGVWGHWPGCLEETLQTGSCIKDCCVDGFSGRITSSYITFHIHSYSRWCWCYERYVYTS